MIFEQLGINKMFVLSIVVAMQIELLLQASIDYVIDPLAKDWTEKVEKMSMGKVAIGPLINVAMRSLLIVLIVWVYAKLTTA